MHDFGSFILHTSRTVERDFENQEDEEMEDAKPEKGKAREKTPDVQAGAEVQVCDPNSNMSFRSECANHFAVFDGGYFQQQVRG